MNHVGTAALGCPAERSSAILFSRMQVELRSTGQRGGCPHVVLGDKDLTEARIYSHPRSGPPARPGNYLAAEPQIHSKVVVERASGRQPTFDFKHTQYRHHRP